MRVFLKCTLPFVIFLVSSPTLAQHASHPDNKINYLTCDGRVYSAYWVGDDFLHVLNGNGPVHQDKVIRYLTWDNRCWEAYYDREEHNFIHKDILTGAMHRDILLNYLTTDGSMWSAIRTKEGFFHEYVAPPPPENESGFSKILRKIKEFCERNDVCYVAVPVKEF